MDNEENDNKIGIFIYDMSDTIDKKISELENLENNSSKQSVSIEIPPWFEISKNEKANYTEQQIAIKQEINLVLEVLTGIRSVLETEIKRKNPSKKDVYNDKEKRKFQFCIDKYQIIIPYLVVLSNLTIKPKNMEEIKKIVEHIKNEYLSQESPKSPINKLAREIPKIAKYGIMDNVKILLSKIGLAKSPDKKIVDIIKNEKLAPLTFSRGASPQRGTQTEVTPPNSSNNNLPRHHQ
jgi:hypothetical protein